MNKSQRVAGLLQPGVFLTFAFLSFFLVCGMVSSVQASQRQVIVGVYDSPPLSSTKNLKEDRGMLLKILRYVADKEGWSLKYVPGTLSELQTLLENGQIDLLVGAPYSKEYAGRYRFTRDTTISTWAQIYSKKPSNIQSLLDLKNLTIGVVKEDPYNSKIREAVKSFDINCIFLEFNSYDEVMQALEKGWIDAGIIDRLFGTMQEGGRKVYRTSVILSPIEIRFAARNELSEQLISPLDYHLEKLKKNQGSLYYKLLKEINTVKDDSKLLMILRWGLVVAAILVLIFLGESILLQRRVRKKTSELLRNNEELEKEIHAREKIEASLKEELSQRKLVEKALKESEERYRNVFENTGTANIIIEEDLTISMANARAIEMSGYTRDEMVGKMKSYQFLAEEDRDRTIRYHLNRVGNKPDQPKEYEVRMANRDGGFSRGDGDRWIYPGDMSKHCMDHRHIRSAGRMNRKGYGLPQRWSNQPKGDHHRHQSLDSVCESCLRAVNRIFQGRNHRRDPRSPSWDRPPMGRYCRDRPIPIKPITDGEGGSPAKRKTARSIKP